MNCVAKALLAGLIAFMTVGANPGQAQETGKRIGEKLDDVGRDIRGGLNRAGQETKEQFASAKTSVQNMGVESRVYGRLHWDKALNDATIELTVTDAGVVTLNGSVGTAKAKVRAAELAQETVGVTEVVDRLAVRPKRAPSLPRFCGRASNPDVPRSQSDPETKKRRDPMPRSRRYYFL